MAVLKQQKNNTQLHMYLLGGLSIGYIVGYAQLVENIVLFVAVENTWLSCG